MLGRKIEVQQQQHRAEIKVYQGHRRPSILQDFLELELDFLDPFSGSLMISTWMPKGHHHSCSSGVARHGRSWHTTRCMPLEVGGEEGGGKEPS